MKKQQENLKWILLDTSYTCAGVGIDKNEIIRELHQFSDG